MSAQGGTLERRGTIQLPMWTVAALLAAAIAAAIGLTVFTDARPDGIVTSVTDGERLANSSAAIREQGGSLPAVWGVSHVSPRAGTFAGFENPGAYVAKATTYAVGLENPGAYGTDGPFTPTVGPHEPITVNGEPCPQCR